MAEQSKDSTREVTRQLGYLLGVAQASVWRDIVATFEPFGIKPQQYAVMARLETFPGTTLDLLAQALRMKAPYLVAMIEDLVGRNLVAKRRRDHDRRLGFLELTPHGKVLLGELKKADDVHTQALADALGAPQLDGLIGSLRRLDDFSSTSTTQVARKRA